MRRLVKKLWVAGALAFLVAALAVAATGATRTHGLDRSYGDRGVVAVPSPFASGMVAANAFGAAGDGDAYVVGRAAACESQNCPWRAFLLRFGPDGRRDMSFGGDGTVFLPNPTGYPPVTVIADHAARPVVGEVGKSTIVLRRFDLDGESDKRFGKAGVVDLRCGCAEAELELLSMPGGRLLVVASGEVRNKEYESVATKVHLVELLPDGAKDASFAQDGVLDLKIPKRDGLEAMARTSGGAILFGGSSCCSSNRHLWLRRVTAGGRVDRRFNRNAALSLRRLGRLGEFPSLVSVVPRADGTIAAIGRIQVDLGFYLRLRKDGRLATGFGVRGLVRLPFRVLAAVGGIHGAVFMVGQGKRRWRYSAYRALADGRLDPVYHGAHGIEVPLPGEGVHVQSQGGGRALVTSYGLFECRQGCPPKPGMARFRE